MLQYLKNIGSSLLNGLDLSKFYLITAIIKFPLAVSKNGLLNSAIVIFSIGMICSTTANILLHKTSKNLEKKNYSLLTKELLSKFNYISAIVIFFFRCVLLMNSIDLCVKYLISLNADHLFTKTQINLIILALLLLTLFIRIDFNKVISPKKRNFILYLVTLALLGTVLWFNFEDTSVLDKLRNPSTKFFDSFPFVFMCFAQQTNIVPQLHDTSVNSIITSGLLSSMFYFIIGAIGYSYTHTPDANFFHSIDHFVIRSIGSILFMLNHLVSFKPLLELVNEDIANFTRANKIKGLKTMLKVILTVALTSMASYYISFKIAPILNILLSILIMNIFPSLMYLTLKNQEHRYSVMSWTNFSVGFYVGVLAILDYDMIIL